MLTSEIIVLHRISKAPPYMPNDILDTEFKYNSVHEKAIIFYKRFQNCIVSRFNPLIKNIWILIISGYLSRWLSGTGVMIYVKH